MLSTQKPLKPNLQFLSLRLLTLDDGAFYSLLVLQLYFLVDSFPYIAVYLVHAVDDRVCHFPLSPLLYFLVHSLPYLLLMIVCLIYSITFCYIIWCIYSTNAQMSKDFSGVFSFKSRRSCTHSNITILYIFCVFPLGLIFVN